MPSRLAIAVIVGEFASSMEAGSIGPGGSARDERGQVFALDQFEDERRHRRLP
jgi:hypothetical protein